MAHLTYLGRTFAVTDSAYTGDFDKTSLEAATYKDIACVGNFGEYGPSNSDLTYSCMSEAVNSHQKGVGDYGSPDMEVAHDDADEGQQTLRTAGAIDEQGEFVVKIGNTDGSTDYLLCIISGPRTQAGDNDDFYLDVYSCLINDLLHVDAP